VYWDHEEIVDDVDEDGNFQLSAQRQWYRVAACANLARLTQLRHLTLFQATLVMPWCLPHSLA
jgi:hypothetical protein